MDWTKYNLPKAYYQDDWTYIINGDCREVLPLIPDKSVDLVLTDPPYGINFTQRTTGCRIRGDDKPMDISFLINMKIPSVIWGANYFIPPTSGRLIWLKRAVEVAKTKSYADAEVAWCSEINTVKVHRQISDGCIREGEEFGVVRYHPSQKPIALIKWCFSFLPDGVAIDPFMGSGTIPFAAKQLNRYSIGIEIEEKYCEIAAKRCSQQVFDFASLEEVNE